MSSESQDYVLGITLGLLGSIVINTGNNIQSLGLKGLQSHEKVEPEPAAVVTKQKASSSLPTLPAWLSPPPGKKPNARRGSSLPWMSPGPRTVPSDTNNDDNEPEFVVVKVGKKSPVQSATWVVGTIVFVTGSLLNFS